jgi:hypothetical protein
LGARIGPSGHFGNTSSVWSLWVVSLKARSSCFCVFHDYLFFCIVHNLVAGVIKRVAPVWNENQAAGLTSILLLTRTPGFALFANSVAFSRAAWERTVPDSVISFLSAIAFTLRLASFN